MTRGIVALSLLAALAAGQDKLVIRRVQTISPPFLLSESGVQDLDGDGRAEILWIGARGEVRTLAMDPKTKRFEKTPRGELDLPEPDRTLLALADLAGKGPKQLVTLTRSGATAYSLGGNTAFLPGGTRLASRAKFRLRSNEPLFAPVIQDINGDGRPDLLVPTNDACEIWLNLPDGEGGTGLKLRRTATIRVDVRHSEKMAGENLSDRLASSFTVPSLDTQDVNGDGRRDLIVKHGRTRAWHMQRPDGTFPADPDVFLDLTIFRDTAPETGIRPGRILAGSQKARFQSRDLDGDAIPDYVIGHRRKVWVFHGNKEKPQFVEPTTILKVSDDLTALLIVNLDDDERPDLLLFKVQIPSVSELVMGALRSFTVDIGALGYRNEGGRAFSRSPGWKSDITVKLPSILKLLRDRATIMKQFEAATSQLDRPRRADLTGDGAREILIRSEAGNRIDVWRGKDSPTLESPEKILRRFVFEDENKTWNLDRLLSVVSSEVNRYARALTAGRDPETRIALRDPAQFEFIGYDLADFDGDKRREILIRYRSTKDAAKEFFDLHTVH